MISPTILLIALPTWIVGVYLIRRMKQIADKEVSKQPVPIPVKAKREGRE
ncbi:MAG: hypothetical protein WAM60_02655 [Candidatus Promineifilaceae bacterium]